MGNEIFATQRRHYPMLDGRAYFETAATGAVPDYVYEGYKGYQDARYLRGGDSCWQGKSTFEMIEWARDQLAGMLGAGENTLAFGENTSQMLGQLVAGLPTRAGDNVIITDTSFISVAYAWDLKRQNEGVELRRARSHRGVIEPERIFELVDGHTRVIALNHVESRTGFRHDLAAIGAFCRERDILLMVDAAQSAGVMAIDALAMGIDLLAGNNYKWMQGFCGTGYGCLSSRAMERLRPIMAGWKSHRAGVNQDVLTLELRQDALRFEYGYPNAPGVYALGLVAERYRQLGAAAIEAYTLELTGEIHRQAARREGLAIWSDYRPENLSQITILTADERYELSDKALEAAGVVAYVKPGELYGAKQALRLGAHYYNDLSDVERLFGALDSLKK